MSTGNSLVIQLVIILAPVAALLGVKKKCADRRLRVAAAVALALLAAALAYYFAAEHGWRPITRSGPAANLSPIAIAGLTAPPLLIALVVIALAKPKRAGAQKASARNE